MFCGKIVDWAPDGTRGWSVFWQMDGLEYHFPKERTSDSFVLQSIAVSPQPDRFKELAAMEAAGVNGCQGTPRSGVVATTIWSREDPLFPVHR